MAMEPAAPPDPPVTTATKHPKIAVTAKTPVSIPVTHIQRRKLNRSASKPSGKNKKTLTVPPKAALKIGTMITFSGPPGSPDQITIPA